MDKTGHYYFGTTLFGDSLASVGNYVIKARMLSWLKKMLATEIDPQDTLGARGENAAAKYLRELGYRIITRNFKVEMGEIDIIARDGPTLVFVEVKTRVDDSIATPEAQVNEPKQHQITKVAKLYMSRYGSPRPPARFDVVSVLWPPGRAPQIKHLIDAFAATF